MKEFYPPVNLYGIGEIMKNYAKFPHFLPCPVSIQHGWTNMAVEHDAIYDAPENWYWSKESESRYRNSFEGLTTRTVGAPFLYLLKNLAYKEPSQKQGSIVFPCHSATFIEVKCDFDEYAALLNSLPDKYKPITVCMYYLDKDKGMDKPFKEQGFEIVTNGNDVYDTKFLENFIHNVHGKKYCFSNQMTSALLFCSAMGLISFFYGNQFITDSREPLLPSSFDYTEHHRQWEAKYLPYFKFPDCDIEQQKQIVFKELGTSYLLTPLQAQLLLFQKAFHPKYLNKLFGKMYESAKWRVNNQINKISST